jgi:hypothetical protein
MIGNNPDVFGVRLLHLGDGDVPGPEVFWMSDWDRWYTLAFQAVLIQGAGVNVLVGTGPAHDLEPMNRQWATFLGARAAMRRPDGHWIGDLLATVGLSPGDITHVVLTPLQLYTTSNVAEFTNATIALSERGWTHFHRTNRHPHDERWSSLPPAVLHHMTHEAWDRVRLLADEDEIVPGIRTWWAGAHHRASVAVEIDSTVGTVTVTDAYFVRRNLDADHPIGICENIYEALAVYERVRRVADVPLTIYDAEQLARFPDGVVAPPPPA